MLGYSHPETPRAADAPKIARYGSSIPFLNWVVLSKHQNFQCYGLPELADSVPPGARCSFYGRNSP